MTPKKEHFYHHKWCEECKRYTVHDGGKCTVCLEGNYLKDKTIPIPELEDKKKD